MKVFTLNSISTSELIHSYSILVFLCLFSNLALLSSFLSSEMKRKAELKANKRILKWEPFWHKVYVDYYRFRMEIMHQSIPAVPIPPRAIVGHFPALSIPGVGALAFHPISSGHLTISLLSPHNIIVSFNDHFIGKYGKFLLEYV